MRLHLSILATAGVIVFASPGARGQCCGDCNADGSVTISELITSVNESLSGCEQSQRFVDNGDGTLTDTRTGLIWEKKRNQDGIKNPDDPHDADNTYTWDLDTPSRPTPLGTVFTVFLVQLNGGPTGVGNCRSSFDRPTGGFANRCDWRLPTLAELQSVVDQTQGFCGGGTGPCVDPAFGPLIGVPDAQLWSSNPDLEERFVWRLDFSRGRSNRGTKSLPFYARAVRGGS